MHWPLCDMCGVDCDMWGWCQSKLKQGWKLLVLENLTSLHLAWIVHWPVPLCSCSIRSQLRSILFYLACTHMHSYMYTCACVYLLIILFDVYIYTYTGAITEVHVQMLSKCMWPQDCIIHDRLLTWLGTHSLWAPDSAGPTHSTRH